MMDAILDATAATTETPVTGWTDSAECSMSINMGAITLTSHTAPINASTIA